MWIQRLEGLVFFLLAVLIYYHNQGNWMLFFLLFLAPDISMIGYLKNNKLGAFIYNLGHNYVLAVSIIIIGAFLVENEFVTQLGYILFAHVAFDRFFGFGLKYPSGFKDTHLQKLR